MRAIILGKIMGLSPELSGYTIPAMKLTFVVAFTWSYAALLRGLLAAMRRTGVIAITAGLRLLVVMLLGCITFFLPQLNGAVIGVVAVGGAFAVESVYLGLNLWQHYRSREQLFPHLQEGSK